MHGECCSGQRKHLSSGYTEWLGSTLASIRVASPPEWCETSKLDLCCDLALASFEGRSTVQRTLSPAKMLQGKACVQYVYNHNLSQQG